MVPLGACKLSASCTRLCRHLLVCSASFPPFSSRPLAVAMDSPETYSKEVTSRVHKLMNKVLLPHTWGRQSGRDSKMTSSTPMGTLS